MEAKGVIDMEGEKARSRVIDGHCGDCSHYGNYDPYGQDTMAIVATRDKTKTNRRGRKSIRRAVDRRRGWRHTRNEKEKRREQLVAIVAVKATIIIKATLVVVAKTDWGKKKNKRKKSQNEHKKNKQLK